MSSDPNGAQNQRSEAAFEAALRDVAKAMVASPDTTLHAGESQSAAEMADISHIDSARRNDIPKRFRVLTVAAASLMMLVALIFGGGALGSRGKATELGPVSDARTIEAASASNPPSAGPTTKDHWLAVYGVYDCTIDGDDPWIEPFDSNADEVGIHSHRDGLIHIHPFFDESSGPNAQMHHFFEAMGIEVASDAIVLDDGHALTAGTECADGSGPAVIRLHRWNFSFIAEDGGPATQIVDEGFGTQRFMNDREVYVLAYAAIDTPIPPPPQDRFDSLQRSTAPIDRLPPSSVDSDIAGAGDLPTVAEILAGDPERRGFVAVARDDAGDGLSEALLPEGLADVRTIPVYDEPNGEPRILVDDKTAAGVTRVYPLRHEVGGTALALRVVDSDPSGDWLLVQAPHRPSDSVVWVRSADFDLGPLRRRIEIDLSGAGSLQVLQGDDVVFEAPIAQGRGSSPTLMRRAFVYSAMSVSDDISATYGTAILSLGPNSQRSADLGGDLLPRTFVHGTDGETLLGQRVTLGEIRVASDDLGVVLALVTPGTSTVIFDSSEPTFTFDVVQSQPWPKATTAPAPLEQVGIAQVARVPLYLRCNEPQLLCLDPDATLSVDTTGPERGDG